MIKVRTEIRKSTVHGHGLFASANIPKGTVIWSFSRIFDHLIPQHVYANCEKNERERLFARGFRNPHGTQNMIMCGDEGQFLNFPLAGKDPNVVIGGYIDGYDVLVAAHDIDIGDELLVTPESDLDYLQKMNLDR